jgi:hypothetical protein
MSLLLCLVLAVTSAKPFLQSSPAQGWNTYSNAAYGYEIRFPAEFEARATGPEGQRDGRALRIARKEYAAPFPVLDVFVGRNAAAGSLPEGTLPDMDRESRESRIGKTPASVTTLRWKATREIAFVQVSTTDVVLVLQPGTGVADINGTVWWEIIHSFRFVNR